MKTRKKQRLPLKTCSVGKRLAHIVPKTKKKYGLFWWEESSGQWCWGQTEGSKLTLLAWLREKDFSEGEEELGVSSPEEKVLQGKKTYRELCMERPGTASLSKDVIPPAINARDMKGSDRRWSAVRQEIWILSYRWSGQLGFTLLASRGITRWIYLLKS